MTTASQEISPANRFAGALVRRERLGRGLSLKGLAHDICAVSYLSKIERGEADPSPEIVRALMARLGLAWHDDEAFLASGRSLLDRGFDAVLSNDEPARVALREELAACADSLSSSPLAAEAALLDGLLSKPVRPVDAELEVLLDGRLLGLQRLAQHRYDDALRLNPCAYVYLRAGVAAYESGEKNNVTAIERLRRAYALAAEEGRVRVMLSAKVCLGNCYSNQLDFQNMEVEYRVVERLARTLGENDLLQTISYNRAAVQIERGCHEEAYGFFSAREDPSVLDLHKLAVCCESLGLRDEALAALDRVGTARHEEGSDVAEDLAEKFCGLVRFRLENPDYLRRPEYGEALLEVFARCRAELPIGFAAFHLPWVREWYTANRQYRAAFELERDFPLKLPAPAGRGGAGEAC